MLTNLKMPMPSVALSHRPQSCSPLLPAFVRTRTCLPLFVLTAPCPACLFTLVLAPSFVLGVAPAVPLIMSFACLFVPTPTTRSSFGLCLHSFVSTRLFDLRSCSSMLFWALVGFSVCSPALVYAYIKYKVSRYMIVKKLTFIV
jgi:hypothetical protein